MGHVRSIFLAAAAVTVVLVAAPRPAEASSTHFLVQLQGGLSMPPLQHLDPTLGFGLHLGAGGRLSGTPLRFYFILGFDRAGYHAHASQQGIAYETRHAFNDLVIGVRMLLPVVWKLRWYVEVLGGGSFIQNELEEGVHSSSAREWMGLMAGTTGLELRWHRNLATGLRADLRWLLGDRTALAPVLDDPRDGTFRISVMLTQSFMF